MKLSQTSRSTSGAVNQPKERRLSGFSKFRSTYEYYKKISLTSDSDSLLAWDAKDIAKQLTLIDFKIFAKVDVYEMLKKRWNHSEFSYECHNVTTAIKRFNSLSFWIQHVILQQEKHADRDAIINKFISIASHCLKFHNYNTAYSIYAAVLPFHSNGVWNITEEVEREYTRMQELFKTETFMIDMAGRYKKIPTPAVPCISYFTKAFFRLQDNVNFFTKVEDAPQCLRNSLLTSLAETCKLMRRFQSEAYSFKKNENMYNYLKKDYKVGSSVDYDSSQAEEILRERIYSLRDSLEFHVH